MHENHQDIRPKMPQRRPFIVRDEFVVDGTNHAL
jgi:hypothetical protein